MDLPGGAFAAMEVAFNHVLHHASSHIWENLMPLLIAPLDTGATMLHFAD